MLSVVIRARGLAKRFGKTHALRGVDLAIDPGEVVGFVGPNGAGKTTALRLVSGFLVPDSGVVEVSGIDVHNEPHRVAPLLGYLPERGSNYLSLRVVEQLAFQASLCGFKRSERQKRVEAVMEEFSLVDVSKRLVGTLSRGYAQRVALATLLLARPKVILLDEPMAGLDPIQRREFCDLLACHVSNTSVLFSSHILTDVAALCDRLVFLVNGVSVAEGTPEQLCIATQKNSLDDVFDSLVKANAQ